MAASSLICRWLDKLSYKKQNKKLKKENKKEMSNLLIEKKNEYEQKKAALAQSLVDNDAKINDYKTNVEPKIKTKIAQMDIIIDSLNKVIELDTKDIEQIKIEKEVADEVSVCPICGKNPCECAIEDESSNCDNSIIEQNSPTVEIPTEESQLVEETKKIVNEEIATEESLIAEPEIASVPAEEIIINKAGDNQREGMIGIELPSRS